MASGLPHRDVAAFDERASGYEAGWRGRLHCEIADRTMDLALRTSPSPKNVLDVGCGTGYLLRQLAERYPEAATLLGVDAAPSMAKAAAKEATDPRLAFCRGVAEHLPFDNRTFDLVVSTTSFDHWADQALGLAECARVLQPGGALVLVDQFSAWLAPTLVAGRRDKARTKRRATKLLSAAGFQAAQWHDLYAVIIRAVTATAPGEDSGASVRGQQGH
jgi:ubiquinone/menaquinone biosynthesis C-methylase UbiE